MSRTNQHPVNYKIESVEECVFNPKPLLDKHKVNKANAGSRLNFAEWDFEKGTHTMNHIYMCMCLEFDESENTIKPARPGVFLVKPIKIKKGDITQLC